MKIKFVDFWQGFNPHDNFIINSLNNIGKFEVSDKPEIIFYSCYGSSYREYKLPRIYYSAENGNPDFTACDFAITSNYINDSRHFRYPVYALYANTYKWWDKLREQLSPEDILKSWMSKKRECCMVVSNKHGRRRNEFFYKLRNYINVDSGGLFCNNIGGRVVDKLAFIKDYKFVLSFENSKHPGYITEKIIEPILTKSIPIYWGDPDIGKEINTKRIIIADKRASDKDVIDSILRINANPELAMTYLTHPFFKDNTIPYALTDKSLQDFLSHALYKCRTITPVATKKSSRIVHSINRKAMTIKSLSMGLLGLNFR